ncbi:hypothetical protein Patl1_32816 [Pistacia atlantica]|uniref:Uncharacterized protein n=1 Tax=Pistacia atlantica TaxID=434234 RepID=A0ACC1AP14_9ROSI|nr:hypothetical protein Patl1_32816 [Pistacia atlantica]
MEFLEEWKCRSGGGVLAKSCSGVWIEGWKCRSGAVEYLEKELGIEALKTMKRIKAALDPNNIMNPGKLIPPHICI